MLPAYNKDGGRAGEGTNGVMDAAVACWREGSHAQHAIGSGKERSLCLAASAIRGSDTLGSCRRPSRDTVLYCTVLYCTVLYRSGIEMRELVITCSPGMTSPTIRSCPQVPVHQLISWPAWHHPAAVAGQQRLTARSGSVAAAAAALTSGAARGGG